MLLAMCIPKSAGIISSNKFTGSVPQVSRDDTDTSESDDSDKVTDHG